MALTAGTITTTAYQTLQDTRKVTWLAPEMREYVNEALRATAFVKPDMFVQQQFVALDQGVVQVLPADGVALFDVTRNQSGRLVTQVDKDLLIEANRFFAAGQQLQQVEHYCADPRSPLRYFVTPPNDGTGYVEISYGAVPPTGTLDADVLSVPDSYEDALVNFVLHRAYAKNSKAQDLTKSAAYRQAWLQALGIKSTGQAAAAPKVSQSPGA